LRFIVIVSKQFQVCTVTSGLHTTVTYMKRLAFRSYFLSSCKYFWYGL